MRMLVLFLLFIMVGLWAFLNIHLLGIGSIESIYPAIMSLDLPSNTAELGDSLGILNGLFSSLTIVLALVTVLLQGRELKESTGAQNQQAMALLEQLEQQNISNKLNVLSIRLQFLINEIDRLQGILDKIDGNFEKEELFSNCNKKKKGYQKDAEEINEKIQEIIYSSER